MIVEEIGEWGMGNWESGIGNRVYERDDGKMTLDK